jgi:alkaline phosphatase D
MIKWFSLILLLPAVCKGQGDILSGPMIGAVDTSSAYVLIDVSRTIKAITLYCSAKETGAIADSITKYKSASDDTIPLRFHIKNLQPATVYLLSVKLDEKAVTTPYEASFTTSPSTKGRESGFTFLFGSCLYLNDEGEKKPYGNSPLILSEMFKTPTDFMIWGGDNLYLRQGEWKSAEGIRSRYFKTRRFPLLQPLLASRANYAIWDDHDFGPNDCNKNFPLAETSYKTFTQFWPTRSYGSEKSKGIYQNFSWGDCDFFLMDDRLHRCPAEMPGVIKGKLNAEKTFYGKEQLEWLQTGLLNSKATFKFIVNGGQVLNPRAEKECFRYYNFEYNDLISFILLHKIEGVIFLTGDRHYTELIATQPVGGYTLFDFTCSSFTSQVRNITKTSEAENPYRIPSTLFMGNNFGKITVSGTAGSRKIKLETIDVKGKPVWDFIINEGDVKFK